MSYIFPERVKAAKSYSPQLRGKKERKKKKEKLFLD